MAPTQDATDPTATKNTLDRMVDDVLDYAEYATDADADAEARRETLSDAVYDTAHEYTSNTDTALEILRVSLNSPEDYDPFISDHHDWESVVQAMAFTVARQDIYDALKKQGHFPQN